MIPQHVTEHWRKKWGWSKDQVQEAMMRFSLSAGEARTLGLSAKNICGHPDRKHLARGKCTECYGKWYRDHK